MDELISPVEMADFDEMLSKVLNKFENQDVLIVTKDGKYFGELYPGMLLKFKDNAQQVRIGKIAKKGSVIEEKQTSIREILERFSGGSTRWLCVLNKYDKPVGLIKTKAILPHIAQALVGRKAFEFMEKTLNVDANTPTDKAEQLMVNAGSEELAVIENGRFLGLLTSRDLAVKIKPYLHQKFRDSKETSKIDVEKERVASILTPEFELHKVSMHDGAYDAMKSADFGEAYVFSGPMLQGKLSYQKMLSRIRLEPPTHIEISGLGPEENMFKESIFEEAAALLTKFGKGGNLHLRIKSAYKGKAKKIYEVHGRLEIDGKSYVCSPHQAKGHKENWDIGMAIAEALTELRKMYLKAK
jgi:CBS domain-containing protein